MRSSVLVVWALSLVACVEPGSVTCDDGRTCASGSVCDDAHGLCVDPEQLTACAGKAMFDPCSTALLAAGTCVDQVCLASGCGNTIQEPGEACDDGNTSNGDGCSADCTSDETCGNGIVDPVTGEACDDANDADDDACHADCHVPYCGDGITDAQYGELCDGGTANSLAPDAQCRPNCQPARCGDGILDSNAGEICDDGNLVAGDGCTPDCASDETCHNGVVDYFAGETCDDANAVGADGCSSVCRVEDAAWGRFEQGAPAARMLPAMAYDPVRDRVVLFGGAHPNAGSVDNSTWELVNTTWVRRYPDRSPPAHPGAQMAYDAEHRVMVLFGGENDSDTWTWDGTNWKIVAGLGANPPARTNHAMAYDPIRKRVVLVGGGHVDLQSNAWSSYAPGTWEWDGSTWTFFDNSLGNRVGHTLAFDPTLGAVVSYGGSTDSSEGLNETYAWNGTSWDDISDGTGPGFVGMTLTFDPSIGELVLAGGLNNTTTYRHDPGGWTPMAGTTLPARGWAGLIARPTRGDLIAFGGGSDLLEFSPGAGLAETWRHTASGWAQLQAAGGIMAPHGYGAMTYDSDRGVVIAFGGGLSPSGALANATWQLREGVWSSSVPAGSPSARQSPAMVYDEARGTTVLFGGISGDLSTHLGDTCLFNGTTWSCSTPSTTPGPRRFHAMAYDANRKRTVLFGGTNGIGPGNYLGDTWEWSGTAWESMSPPTKPGVRGHHAMAYDPRRQRVVLYGGYDVTKSYLFDTWEYDGGTWTQIPTQTHPRAAFDAQLTYDAARGTLLLFGGRDGTTIYNDVWEWDGTLWRRVDIQTGLPAPRDRIQATYDAITNAMVMTGGATSSGYVNDSWQFRFASAEASLEWCRNGLDGDRDGLVGCADPDCWGVCTPHCPPETTCDTTLPSCGDGACSVLETSWLCPADCGAHVARCGDFVCEAPETSATCPGDCP